MADKAKARLCISKAKNTKFETFNRNYFEIRDFGLKEATDSRCDGFVTGAPELGGKAGRHYHEHDFQITYALKG